MPGTIKRSTPVSNTRGVYVPKLNEGGSVSPTAGGEDPIVTEGVAALRLKTISGKIAEDPNNIDHQQELDDFKKWYGDYILSDTYRDRLRSSGDYGTEEDMDKITQLRYDALQGITMEVDPYNPKKGHEHSSYMQPRTNEMVLQTHTPMTDVDPTSVIGHEAGHATGMAFDQWRKDYAPGKGDIVDQKAISMNDILDLESRNQQYRDAPNISVKDKMYRTNYKGEEDQVIWPADLEEGSLASDYSQRGFSSNPNVTSIFKGSPTISPENQRYNWADSTLSNEEIAEMMYKFPEGYPEDLKQQELKKLATHIGSQKRDMETQTEIISRRKELSEQIRSEYGEDRGDLSPKEIIDYKVENQLEYVNEYIVGNKNLKKKYRGMSLDEIPDGVDPDIDAYRKSKKLQEEYMDNQKRDKDLDFDYNKGVEIGASYTPEGGDELVIKKGGLHEIGASESGADLVGMRMYLHKKYGWNPKDDITEEQWQQVVRDEEGGKGNTVRKRFMRKYKDQDATYILNNIAMEDPSQGVEDLEGDRMAKHGASLKKKGVRLIKKKK